MLAPAKLHPYLTDIERIERVVQRIKQAMHIPIRMQRPPRLDAGISFARLEHHKQGIKTGGDFDGGVGTYFGCRYVWVEVVQLVGVRLDICVSIVRRIGGMVGVTYREIV